MTPALNPAAAVDAELAFTRIEDVTLDDPIRGLLRARTLEPEVRVDPRSYDRRRCQIRDCSAAGAETPDLLVHGFAHVDLSRRHGLQATLERVRVAGRLGEPEAAEIRAAMTGRVLPLASGARLLLLYVAREGLFLRRAGPNGMALARDASGPAIRDHDAAVAVHADQDVEGTPLRQLLRGAAPRLFRHDSPDLRNERSRLTLLNVWIPLDQVTRPLALMDRRSLDRRAHQLRHGLITDAILQRDASMRVNDVWTFLHDEGQRWYFTSEIDAGRAYVFETLSTPHGSFILPGEARAEARFRQLTAMIAAVRAGDEAAARAAADGPENEDWEPPATASLGRAIAAMESLLAEGRAYVSPLCQGDDSAGWSARATAAAERVVRKSIEMRAMALILPPLPGWRRRS